MIDEHFSNSLEDYLEVKEMFGLGSCVEVIIKTIQYQAVYNVSYPLALEYARQEYRFLELNKISVVKDYEHLDNVLLEE